MEEKFRRIILNKCTNYKWSSGLMMSCLALTKPMAKHMFPATMHCQYNVNSLVTKILLQMYRTKMFKHIFYNLTVEFSDFPLSS
ncbi:hypothetical protein GmHk_20G056832 [Glycine max]|nr:hypothetical protein GmHk_20G056832 [Glycine max]